MALVIVVRVNMTTNLLPLSFLPHKDSMKWYAIFLHLWDVFDVKSAGVKLNPGTMHCWIPVSMSDLGRGLSIWACKRNDC